MSPFGKVSLRRYNIVQTMIGKTWNAKLTHILLGLTLLVGLLPISNHMESMRVISMNMAASPSITTDEKTSDNSPGSCCEAIGSFLLACDFIVFQSAFIDPTGGSEQVAYSLPIVQSIYIQTLAPPPKA